MVRRNLVLVLGFGLFLLLAMSACQPSTPTPSPSPPPPPNPPPASTWVNDQIGITWGDTPVVQEWDHGHYWRTPERVALARQANAPWTWGRWSAFWFWVEQPVREG